MSDTIEVDLGGAGGDIGGLRKRINAWRAQKRWRGEAMPAALWRRAGQLAAQYGAYRIASALGLDYNRLRQEAESREEQTTKGVGFVELPGRLAGGPTTTITVERANAKLKIELERGGVDVVEVVTYFLRGRA